MMRSLSVAPPREPTILSAPDIRSVWLGREIFTCFFFDDFSAALTISIPPGILELREHCCAQFAA
jgi:hypothetical protein